MNKISSLFLLTVCFIVVSCGDSKEKKAAVALLQESTELYENGSFDDAITLLDTLNARFPQQTGVRREAMHLRPAIIEAMTLKEISENDSLQAEQQLIYQRILPSMKRIDNPELVEGYWISASGTFKNIMETTGVEARVSNDGEFYVISEIVGAGDINHDSFSLKSATGDEAFSGKVPYDEELNYRIGDSETVSYDQSKVAEIGEFAKRHRGEKITLVFHGENGKNKSMALTAEQVDAIANAYEMGSAVTTGKRLALRRELLEKKLALSRDQKAHTFIEK